MVIVPVSDAETNSESNFSAAETVPKYTDFHSISESLNNAYILGSSSSGKPITTGIIFATFKSSEKIKPYTKKQSFAGILILIVIMIVVIYLETLFPSYNVVL